MTLKCSCGGSQLGSGDVVVSAADKSFTSSALFSNSPPANKHASVASKRPNQLELLTKVAASGGSDRLANCSSGQNGERSQNNLELFQRNNAVERVRQDKQQQQRLYGRQQTFESLTSDIVGQHQHSRTQQQQQHQSQSQQLQNQHQQPIRTAADLKDVPTMQSGAPVDEAPLISPRPLLRSGAAGKSEATQVKQPQTPNAHQRLQYQPIHKQLQRIYGNKLQEFEQLNRKEQQQLAQRHKIGQQQAGPKHSALASNQRHLQQQHQQQAAGSEMTTDEQQHALNHRYLHINQLHSHQLQQQQHHPHHHHHNHKAAVGAVQPQKQGPVYQQHPVEQAYDSLSPMPAPPPPPPWQTGAVANSKSHQIYVGQSTSKQSPYHKHYHNTDSNFYELHCQHRPDDGETVLNLNRDFNNNHNLTLADAQQMMLTDKQLAERAEELALGHSSGPGGTEMEETTDEGEPETPLQSVRPQQSAVAASKKVLIGTRKRQLESLHYATATAAALLDVTASAAAAFAATDKQLFESHHLQKQRAATTAGSAQLLTSACRHRNTTLPAPPPRVYNETTYQDFMRQPVKDHNQQFYQSGDCSLQPQQQLQHHHQHQRVLLHASPPNDFVSYNRQQMRQQQQFVQQQRAQIIRRPIGQRFQLQPGAESQSGGGNYYQAQRGQILAPDSLLMSPNRLPLFIQQHRTELTPNGQPLTSNYQIQHLLRQNQKQQNHQIQLQRGGRAQWPGMASIEAAYQQSKQHNQAIFSQPPPALSMAGGGAMPALTILQRKTTKQAPSQMSEADLIARLALVANQKQQQQQHHHRLLAAAAAIDPRLLALTTNQMQGNVKLHQSDQQQQLTYGFLIASKGKQMQQQPIYAALPMPLHRVQQASGNGANGSKQVASQLQAKQYQLGAITSASSDASEHSNLPLILNRRVVKPKDGILDKISRIDLTIFWWSLLTVCVIFIAAVLAITGYLS